MRYFRPLLLCLPISVFAQGLTPGWVDLGANTIFRQACPPNGFNTGVTVNGITQISYNFTDFCYNIIQNDGGATVDTKRNRLIIWGGGHNGTSGNDIYALNLVLACGGTPAPCLTRIKDPSVFDTSIPQASNGIGPFSDLTIDGSDNTIVSSPNLPCTQDFVRETFWIASGVNFNTGVYTVASVSGGKCKLSGPAGNLGATNGSWRMPAFEVFASDGLPTPRHTGGGIVYIPPLDKVFAWEGAGPGGAAMRHTWLLDMATLTWTDMTFQPGYNTGYDVTNCGSLTTPCSGSTNGAHCAWDETTQQVMCRKGGTNEFYSYDPFGNKWTRLGATTGMASTGGYGVAIDPKLKLMFFMGSAQQSNPAGNPISVFKVDISPFGSLATTDITSQVGGCTGTNTYPTYSAGTRLNVPSPGMVYDPSINKFVMYPWDGNDVFIFDPISLTCVSQTWSNGPSLSLYAPPNGVHGHWGYFPSLGVYAVVNGAGFTVSNVNHAFKFTLNSTPTEGLGKSTYTCMDRDGDGYGVGPGCLGIDADDMDGNNHTGAQVVAKYGSYQLFLNHIGYNPSRKWYLAPAIASAGCDAGVGSCVGNDGTGAVNDISHPFLTYAAINTSVTADDIVVMRDGWNGRITPPTTGTANSGISGHPIIFASYPGERALFDRTGPNAIAGAGYIDTDVSFAVFDGAKFTFASPPGGIGTDNTSAQLGVSLTFNKIYRNMETVDDDGGGLGGIAGFNCLNNIVIEDNVFHDATSGAGHDIYLGARFCPDNSVMLRRNILYHSNVNGMHLNGRMFNTVVENNWIRAVANEPLSLQMGVSKSYIQNNVFWGGNAALDLRDYVGSIGQNNCGPANNQVCTCPNSVNHPGTQNEGSVCAYDQNFNVFQNNTWYMNGTNPCGNPTCTIPDTQLNMRCIVISGDPEFPNVDLGNNIYRNNIFTNYGNNNVARMIAAFDAATGNQNLCGSVCQGWLSSSKFQNNMFWQMDGAGVLATANIVSVGSTNYTCAGATAVTTMSGCSFLNPLFVNAGPAVLVDNANLRLQSASPAIGLGSNGLGLATFSAPNSMESVYDSAGTAYSPTAPALGGFEANCIFTTFTLPNGTTGTPYSQTVTSAGCSTPLVFSISSGTLPTGLNINSSTGLISGTPSAGGPFNFIVSILDNVGNNPSQNLSIQINAGATGSKLSGNNKLAGSNRVQ